MPKRRKTKPKPPELQAGLFDMPETPASVPQEPPKAATAPTPAPSSKAPPAGPESGLWVRELRAFPAAHFGGLGPTSLHVELDGAPLVFTTSREGYARAREQGVPVFVARELVALAHAAQNDRMPGPSFRKLVERKRKRSALVVSPALAFGGMPLDNAERLRWTIGEALDEMRAELVRVEDHANPQPVLEAG